MRQRGLPAEPPLNNGRIELRDGRASVRPVTQSILHDDPMRRPGDCLRAAVASLLELPLLAVPHFVLHHDWRQRMNGFCRGHGYRAATQDLDTDCAYGIALGPSPRGVQHAVCWVDGRMAHDPHPSRAGLLRVTHLIALHRTRRAATVHRPPAGEPPMTIPPPPEPTTFWPPPAPNIGQRVLYRLTPEDVRAIHRQRLAANVRATPVRADDVLPAIVVRVLDTGVLEAPLNLHVHLDGPDMYWARGITSGTTPGTWAWPTGQGA